MSGLVDVTLRLRRTLRPLQFAHPVTHVYRPLEYAWAPARAYLSRYGRPAGQVLLVGMNPGPFGMAQTGVPFGDVGYVRDFLGLSGAVDRPDNEHPLRPVQGFACTRREVSGSRLWGWAEDAFGTPEAFFARFFVYNYCPLVFMEESCRNRTPDKLPVAEREALFAACDAALAAVARELGTELAVGIGGFAANQVRRVLEPRGVRVGQVLHPSPASPLANRGWAPQASAALRALGVVVPEGERTDGVAASARVGRRGAALKMAQHTAE